METRGDLPGRSLTLVRSIVGSGYVLEGLSLVPGDGPVILWIETEDANAIPAICAAMDRHVTVLEPNSSGSSGVKEANAILERGDIVAIRTTIAAGVRMGEQLQGLKLRVRTEGKCLLFEEFTS